MHEWVPLLAWLNALFDAAAGATMFIAACRNSSQLNMVRLVSAWTLAVLLSWLSLLLKAGWIAIEIQSPLPAVYLALVWIGLTPLLMSLFVLFHFRHKMTKSSGTTAYAVSGLCLVASITAAYAGFVEPYWLEVKEVDIGVAGVPADSEPIRVAVLADIQTDVFGAYEQQWLEKLSRVKPDLIVMPGDFFDCRLDDLAKHRDTFVQLMQAIRAPYGVYACQGNIDELISLRSIFSESDVQLLVDEIAVVNIRGVNVAIGGTRYVETQLDEPPLLRQMSQKPANIRLMMAHVPDAVNGARLEDDIDLIVSGHTHGGQVQMPGFGPLVIASNVPRAVGAGGLHTLNGQRIYVSRGIGHERQASPPLRFWCRPEMTILRLIPLQQ